MNPMSVDDARKAVSKVFGEQFAAKASAALCLGLTQPAFGSNVVGIDAAPGQVQAQSLVIEFGILPEGIAEAHNAIEELRHTKAWMNLRSVIKKTTKDPRVSNAEAFIHAGHLLRQAKILTSRNSFYQMAGGIRNEIERVARGFFRPGPETTASTQFPSAITEVCWLNGAVRVYADARSLSDVVAEKSIERIDIPRRLQGELNVSGNTVGAPQFREKFNRTGKGVIVAVIDQEAALNHPALAGRVIHRKNFSREPWGTPGPHATAIAGIIGSNDNTFPGIAPEALIYNYKVRSTSSVLNGDDFDGALAIQQALEDGAHVANCSWGTGSPSLR